MLQNMVSPATFDPVCRLLDLVPWVASYKNDGLLWWASPGGHRFARFCTLRGRITLSAPVRINHVLVALTNEIYLNYPQCSR